MNCFWIVSLKYWAQRKQVNLETHISCELLLNCIFEILSTAEHQIFSWKGRLWIAFELYLWNIEHSVQSCRSESFYVVNCFWIVSLKYWAQLPKWKTLTKPRCELLLNCIFEILSTAVSKFIHLLRPLWIAFELYLWNIEHSSLPNFVPCALVVNCFWIVSLKYWAQQRLGQTNTTTCCELLLNCIFEILSTARGSGQIEEAALWIAFELYLWNIEHSWTKR